MRSDEQLMLDFQGGTVRAFEELFERYRDPLYRFFRRRLTNITRAEDLTQEMFIVVLRGTERYEPQALGRLDPEHREVLMLREYEQLSYDEIAELLQIPINTLRSRLFRARAELKAFLESQTTKEASR